MKFPLLHFNLLLTNLFNESPLSGEFSSCPNNVRLIPIHKSGSEFDVENYRPISTILFIGNFF